MYLHKKVISKEIQGNLGFAIYFEICPILNYIMDLTCSLLLPINIVTVEYLFAMQRLTVGSSLLEGFKVCHCKL